MHRKFHVGLEGRAWEPDEAHFRHDELPQKIEMIRGKIFWSDDERVLMPAALLEQMGATAAVHIGDADVWRAAVRELDGV